MNQNFSEDLEFGTFMVLVNEFLSLIYKLVQWTSQA